MLPGQRLMGLTTMQTIGNKEGVKGLMALRVRLTPNRFPTNVVYALVNSIHKRGRCGNFSLFLISLNTESATRLSTEKSHV